MTDLRTAAQQALEALEGELPGWRTPAQENAITALRAALAQQEPVTWGVDWGRDNDQSCCTIIKRHADGTQEVVAVEYGPPRREWRGLTDDEISALFPPSLRSDYKPYSFARAIEQALKERNT